MVSKCDQDQDREGKSMAEKRYTDLNSHIIDRWVDAGWEWGRPISHEMFLQAKEGHWDVVLTPTKPVPHEWFLPFPGAKLLGLASGGGQQMPIFTALGASCSVLDYSQKQLDSEIQLAGQEGYDIEIVKADMTKPLPFESESFDMIFHPVSNSYVEEVLPIWKECFRILKRGGVLLTGVDIGINYIFDDSETTLIHSLPFNPLKDPALYQECMDADVGVQFSHTTEEQVGGLLKAGFMITDLYEDTNGYGKLHEFNIPTFLSVRAMKP